MNLHPMKQLLKEIDESEQADALRAAVTKFKSINDCPPDVKRRLLEILIEANQLHPLRESNVQTVTESDIRGHKGGDEN